MKKILFLCAPLCVMLMTACVKDEPNAKFIKLYAEGLTPSSKSAKAAVAGNATYWVDGDRVRINSQVFKVQIDDPEEGTAVAVMEEGVAPEGPISAVYPSSVYKSNAGSTYTITVPKQYVYRESGVTSGHKQILDGLPMVAYSSETAPESLVFSHLTAAITVRVKNTLDVDLDLFRIDLINDEYKMCGDIAVDFSDFVADANSIPRPVVTAATRAGGDTVSLIFDEVKKTVPKGEYRDIQIPILPIGGGEDGPNSKFTVKIEARDAANHGVKYKYSRVQGADGDHPTGVSKDNTILRAQLGYATSRYDASTTSPSDIFDKMSDGEHDGYYAISSADDFKELADAMNKRWENVDDDGYNHSNYYITDDIDMNNDTIPPLHYYSQDCTFDGGEHTISHIVIDSRKQNDEQENLCGLFTEPEGNNITIKGLTLDNVEYVFGHKDLKVIKWDNYPQSAVGGIFGHVGFKQIGPGKFDTVMIHGTVIENCHIKNVKMNPGGDITSGEQDSAQVDDYFGGIVGLVCNDCVIRNCSVENVIIDNEREVHIGKIVDQFGGAIGRIAIPDRFVYTAPGGRGYDNSPQIVIEDFKYDQGSNFLELKANLQRLRCGGLIANITRGSRTYFKNDTVILKLKINYVKNELYVGGLIGCHKDTKTSAFQYEGSIVVQGEIHNNCTSSYAASKTINRYFSAPSTYNNSMKQYNKSVDGSAKESLSYCTTPTGLITLSAGSKTSVFHHPKQSFFAYRDDDASDLRPTPGAKRR